MSFLKPGSKSESSFGFTFSRRTSVQESRETLLPTPHLSAEAEAAARLPIARYKRHIQYLVENHATCIVLGEAGCGKSTQIPKFLLEAGWAEQEHQIVCTQPRRIAAVTVATRVASELSIPLGELVGYAVRFEDKITPGITKLKYVTDGVLLREMMDDPLLTAYSVVMVDEAHERSLATDLLLGLLKKVQARRPDLRLIISSATLEAEKLAKFFDGSARLRTSRPVQQQLGQPGMPRSLEAALMTVEGRQYPVQVHYALEPAADYVKAAVAAACDIHREDVPGDILIFLTGQEECEAAVKLLDEEARRLARSALSLKMLPLPLYAGLPMAQQQSVMDPAPRGIRKVVASTNVAETSLTLQGVVYVIDCCFVKQKVFNPLKGLEALLVAPVPKSAAFQRAGRAGRVRPGHCFRLCTEEDFVGKLPEASVPEVQRSDLSGMVLQLKALGIDNIMNFDWLSPPPAEIMVRALEALHALGALDEDAKLTATGASLSALPLEPMLGACLLAAAKHSCSEELVVVVSMLSVQGVWRGAGGSPKALEAAKAKFAVAEGDLVTFLNVYRGWRENNRSSQWCHRNFIHPGSLYRAQNIARQLAAMLTRLQVPIVSCNGEMEAVSRAVAAGLFANAACFERVEYDSLAPEGDPGTNVYRLARDTGAGQPARLRVHPSSVLMRTQVPWLVFASVQQNDSGWYEMRNITPVQPDWLLEAAPHMYRKAQPHMR